MLPPPVRCGKVLKVQCLTECHDWLFCSRVLQPISLPSSASLQIRVYSLASALEDPDQPRWQLPIRLHRMPSKLSSLAWNPDQPGVVTGARGQAGWLAGWQVLCGDLRPAGGGGAVGWRRVF
mgnify:CR=1 FL=1